MQVVKYDIQDNILEVGFKEDNFVVYTQIGYDENKTKEELLQLAYIQAKPSIDYEKTLDRHSFITKKEGEEFIPENPKPSKLNVDFNNLSGEILDQYGDIYSTNIDFFIEGTDKARIENDIVIVDEVEEDEEYFVVAKYDNLEERQYRTIYALVPSEFELLQQQISEVDNNTAKRHEIAMVKNDVLEVQDFIVNQRYQELLKEGGI